MSNSVIVGTIDETAYETVEAMELEAKNILQRVFASDCPWSKDIQQYMTTRAIKLQARADERAEREWTAKYLTKFPARLGTFRTIGPL